MDNNNIFLYPALLMLSYTLYYAYITGLEFGGSAGSSPSTFGLGGLSLSNFLVRQVGKKRVSMDLVKVYKFLSRELMRLKKPMF